MSVLTERHDNQVGGGKDIKHPLYVVSRFIPEDSEAVGCCVFRIDIRPPKDLTNFLEDKYNEFKELLVRYGVNSKLENYNGAMSTANWVRKLLVVYVKLNVGDNNQDRFEIVAKTDKEGVEVVDYISFRVHYGTNEHVPLVRHFVPRTLSEWCRNAMKWVVKILEDQSERQFKRTWLYEMMQGPRMDGPMVGPNGEDIIESFKRTAETAKNRRRRASWNRRRRASWRRARTLRF